MMTIEERTKKLEEQREQLRREEEMLSVYSLAMDELESLVNSVQSSLDYYSEIVTTVGYETEQARDEEGRLLFTYKGRSWGAKPLDHFPEEDRDNLQPYFKPITETKRVNNAEEIASDWDRHRYMAYSIVLDALKKIEF